MSVSKDWERMVGEQFDRLARSDAFLGQMGKAMQGSFVFKQTFDRMADQWLRSMRMPTAADVEAVHRRLDELERHLTSIDERLDALARVRVAAPAPAPASKAEAAAAPVRRTKKAPAKPRTPRSRAKAADAEPTPTE